MTGVDLLFDRAPTEVFLTWPCRIWGPAQLSLSQRNRWEGSSQRKIPPKKNYTIPTFPHCIVMESAWNRILIIPGYGLEFPSFPIRLCTSSSPEETPNHRRGSEGAGQAHNTHWTAAPAIRRPFHNGPKKRQHTCKAMFCQKTTCIFSQRDFRIHHNICNV